MARKKTVDHLRPDKCLEVIAEGLNALEERRRHGGDGDELWGDVHSIVGGIVPAVHWPGIKPPPEPRRGEPGFHLLTGTPTTPNPRWTVAGLNRLMRKAGIVPAARLTAQGTPEPFVRQPTELARVAWNLWWCFRLGELQRLRRCEGCGRWFRDSTKPLNQRRCSQRCTKRVNMRVYRAQLRRRKAKGSHRPSPRRRSSKRRRAKGGK